MEMKLSLKVQLIPKPFEKLISLIFLPIVFFGNALYGQDIFTITSIQETNKKINNFIYLYEDSTNKLDISQILDKKERNEFLPLNQFKEKRSFKNTYWLYLSIENNLENVYQVGLGFPPILDHRIDIYSFPDSILQIQTTGFFINQAENDEIIPFSNIVQIENAKRVEFYLKFKNVYNELPDFSIKLVNLTVAIKQNNRLMSFDGYALGMMFIMIMYGLFLFFFKKDKLYLYYSIYIILNVLWYFFITGFGYRLFPDLPRRIYPYGALPSFLGFIFYIQFIRLFVNTSQIFPRLDKILRIFQIILTLECIRIPIFLSLTYSVIVNAYIENILSSVLLICGFILFIKLFSYKSKSAKIIVLGSSFLIVGMLLGIILKLTINDNSFFFNKLGIILELLVFTYGISFR